MSIELAFNYRLVDDGLATSGILSAEQLAALAEQGFGLVINLLPHDNQYAIADEPAILAAQNIRYVSIPVDFAAPDEASFRQFVRVMDGRGDTKTLVHCAANYRVSAFYALYARQRLGWSDSQMQAWIASLWQPDEYPPWPQFIASLS